MKTLKLLLCLLTLTEISQAEVIRLFREDFHEYEPNIPFVNEDLVNQGFLNFEVIGVKGTKVKLSHHPHVEDPHYLYFGPAKGATAALFHFSTPLDLSSEEAKVKIATRNTGGSFSYIMLKSANKWWLSSSSPTQQGTKLTDPFETTEYLLNQLDLKEFDTTNYLPLESSNASFNWSAVEGIGFFSPYKGGMIFEGDKTRSTARIDWFELYGEPQPLAVSKKTKKEQPQFFEKKAPFFSSNFLISKTNEARRGVILRLSNDYWVGFDTDTMRPAAVWQNKGNPLTLDSMGACSYPNVVAKAKVAPSVIGNIVTEVLPSELDQISKSKLSFKGIRMQGKHAIIQYNANEALIEELWNYDNKTTSITRSLTISPHANPIEIQLDSRQLKDSQTEFESGKFSHLQLLSSSNASYKIKEGAEQGTSLLLAPSTEAHQIQISISQNKIKEATTIKPPEPSLAFDFYPSRTEMHNRSTTDDSYDYKIKYMTLPQNNVYNRTVRPMDIAFDTAGNAFICTFDGDVWKINKFPSKQMRWKRFASGLNELTNIEIGTDNRIYVLGRDQITELVDENADDCVDHYICVNNKFIQTLQTRDYTLSMERLPNGNFVITKGGIMMGKKDPPLTHRGTVLEIEPNQGEVKVVADGMRMPYVGVDASGEIFASDQQGHYIPSTPIYHVQHGQSYGFETTNTGNRQITEPLIFFPYLANRSGAGFVSLTGETFAPFNNMLAHVSWNGRLFGVDSNPKQPFSWQVPFALNFSCLNGAIHPKNGKLYLIGVGISGYRPQTEKRMGLAEVTPPQAPLIPLKIDIAEKSITIDFSKQLPTEQTPKVTLKLWDVKRSKEYGSGHYNWVGDPGENQIDIHKVETQGSSLIIHTDRLFNSNITELTISLDEKMSLDLYTKITTLGTYDPKVATKKIVKDNTKLHPADLRRGRAVFTQKACTGCHSLNGGKLTGPPLNGIGKRSSKKELRESILNPSAIIVEGYTSSMPSFSGILSEQELVDVIEFLSKSK